MLTKIALGAALALASLMASVPALGASAEAAPASVPSGRSSVFPGEVLGVNQAVHSPDGRYTFVQQPDGNLVLYNPRRQPTYSTNTARHPGAQSVLQRDGNFVIYYRNRPIFHTNTAHHPRARLDVQNDGNVVIYDGWRAIWQTRTTGR